MTITDPPRIFHNKALSSELSKNLMIAGRYPRVVDQLPTLPLETEKLFPFGYNPTIIRHRGGVVMMYRFHRDETPKTRLGIAELSSDFKVLNNAEFNANSRSNEDPRLFLHRDELWASWVESEVPQGLHGVTRIAKIEGEEVFDPAIGKNDWTDLEKNWLIFDHLGSLFCIYKSHVEQEVYGSPDGKAWTKYTPIEAPHWPYGAIRGGCIVPWNGQLLRFFHSSLRNEFAGPRPWRYYIGALAMETVPPFKVTAVSKRPILYGSEVDMIKVKNRPHHWKANIVFGSGAVEHDGGWVLSVGINDSSITLVKVSEKDLNLC